MSETEIKPCPFCGKQPKSGGSTVTCDCLPYVAFHIIDWNRRSSPIKPLEASGEEKPQWISVKDKLPHRSDAVLGYSHNIEEGFTFQLLYCENGLWEYQGGEKVPFIITHWFDPAWLGKPEVSK